MVYGNVIREKNRFKIREKGKENYQRPLQTNQLNNFTVSL